MTLINVPDSVMELLQREGGELSIQRAGPHNLDWNFAATLTERDEQGHATLLAYGTGSSIAWALYQLTVTLKERREQAS